MNNAAIEEKKIEDCKVVEAEIQKGINNAVNGNSIAVLTFLDKLIVQYESAHPIL